MIFVEVRSMNEKETGMLIDSKDADIILVDTEGQIIFDDIGNYRYFQLGMTSARGKISGNCSVTSRRTILCSGLAGKAKPLKNSEKC